MAIMQKITTHLWFDSQAEEAALFYISIFKNSKLGRIARYNSEGFETHKRPAGSVMTVEFWLEGQGFMALNGGPMFKFNESISLMINCETQQELDYYWDALNEGGDPSAQQCGWLKDKFGLSWQVSPTVLAGMLMDYESERSKRVMRAMLNMIKLDIKELTRAYNG